MKTVQLIPIRNKPHQFGELKPANLIWSMFSHPRMALIICVSFLLIISLFKSAALPFAFSIFAIGALSYWAAKDMAESVHVFSLQFPAKSKERDSIKIIIPMINSGFFPVLNISVSVIYHGCKVPLLRKNLIELWPEQKTVQIEFETENNVGMGFFDLGPVTLHVKDPLGLFEYKVEYAYQGQVEVLPFIEQIPPLNTRGSLSSEMYGNLDLPSKGLSVNFRGLRPYSFGDSIRHIAWRPTARHQSLVVKEFEKVTNTDVTLILNLNPSIHIGNSSASTWESARDATLSVFQQLMEQGHNLQFGYNKAFIEKGAGSHQLGVLLKKLVEYDIFAHAENSNVNGHYTADPLYTWASFITYGSTLFYIVPASYPELRKVRQIVRELIERKVEVVLILIDPSKLWSTFISMNPELGQHQEETQNKLQILLDEYLKQGVKIFAADIGQPLIESFRDYEKT